jgi:hypothetical protein
MPHQPQLIREQPSPDPLAPARSAGEAARDAERAAYLERLREKLKDPCPPDRLRPQDRSGFGSIKMAGPNL